MQALNPISSLGQTAGAAGVSSQSDISNEFETFIRLLTSQVRNQDPLSPLDSTQFVEQLATFSTLEQQVLSNQNLGNISNMIGDLHALAAGEWLGQSVTVASDWAPFSGSPVEFQAELPADADKAVLTVFDSEGTTLFTQDLDTAAELHAWTGETSSGELAAVNETYKLRVQAYRGRELLGEATPRILTTVTHVGSEGGALRLGTAANVTGDLSTISRID